MLLIRRSAAVILMLLAVFSIIITAVLAYRLSGAVPESQELRFRAEQMLFAGIIAACINAAAFGLLLVRSRNISKELDRIGRQAALNPEAAPESLLRLGETGEKLKDLFIRTEEVSEKRGLKISALNSLTDFLCRRSSEAILILDVEGIVVHAGGGYLEKFGLNRGDIIDQPFRLLKGGLTINTVLTRLEQRHLPIETESGSGICRWIPVFNKNNAISYIAVERLQEGRPQTDPN